MAFFKIPVKVVNKLEQLRRRFLWGRNMDKIKMTKFSWEKNCRSKRKCGLGVVSLKENNLAFSGNLIMIRMVCGEKSFFTNTNGVGILC